FLSSYYQTQMIEEPWLCQKLDSLQIQELFGITPDMQALLDKELQDYLSVILADACREKN
ncbi:16212_t:CDS:1, partial [Entrophospora sp. SA101]